jgi:hypothetical protein
MNPDPLSDTDPAEISADRSSIDDLVGTVRHRFWCDLVLLSPRPTKAGIMTASGRAAVWGAVRAGGGGRGQADTVPPAQRDGGVRQRWRS